MSSQQERTCFDKQLPGVGQMGAFAVTAVASVIDLQAAVQTESSGYAQRLPAGTFPSIANSSGGPGPGATPSPRGFMNCWVEISVDSGGGTVAFVAGPSSASVSGANAPVIATTGAPGTAGLCYPLVSGNWERFYVTNDKRFLGVIGSAGATLRIHQSSRAI